MKLTTAFLTVALFASAADYRVTGRIPIGGEGGWDYLTIDASARRAYVSHATHVAVVDLETQKVVGDVPDTPGVHGIAIASKLNQGFTSNGRSNNVTIFDLKTLKATGQVKTGENPDAIIYDPASGLVFTFNGRSKDSTVIDPASGAVKSTIPLGGKPEFAVVDGRGKLWVNIEDTHEIAELDTRKPAVAKRYTLEGCEEPSGLALDPVRRRLFSVCANKVMAISDPEAAKVIATVPIGAGTDGAVYDPGLKLAFSSNGGDGTLTVVSEAGGKYQAATVQTQRGARTMAVDTKSHKLYLPAARIAPGPPPAAGQGRQRPSYVPDSFMLLVVGQ